MGNYGSGAFCKSGLGQCVGAISATPAPSGWAKLPNVNCYMDKYAYDHGAEENLNGGHPIVVKDEDECWQKCHLDSLFPQGDAFTGCEYAVYAPGECYPRKGLQCSQCDGVSGFTLLIPPSWPVDCPNIEGQAPSPTSAPSEWAKLPNVNCYMDKYPYDHGAEENLNGGFPIAVKDEDECWQKCQLDSLFPQGDGFTGCEYAVYAPGECYPRKGLQCSHCDGVAGFTLLIPPSWPVDCPDVGSPTPAPTAMCRQEGEPCGDSRECCNYESGAFCKSGLGQCV